MAKRKVRPARIVRDGHFPKELCLACEKKIMPAHPEEMPAGVSYSRYCDAYICSECGVKEAFEGFFWTIRANAAGVRINAVED